MWPWNNIKTPYACSFSIKFPRKKWQEDLFLWFLATEKIVNVYTFIGMHFSSDIDQTMLSSNVNFEVDSLLIDKEYYSMVSDGRFCKIQWLFAGLIKKLLSDNLSFSMLVSYQAVLYSNSLPWHALLKPMDQWKGEVNCSNLDRWSLTYRCYTVVNFHLWNSLSMAYLNHRLNNLYLNIRNDEWIWDLINSPIN